MDVFFLFYFLFHLQGHRTAEFADSEHSEYSFLWKSFAVLNSRAQTKMDQKERTHSFVNSKKHFFSLLMAAIPFDVLLFVIWIIYGGAVPVIALDVIQGLR